MDPCKRTSSAQSKWRFPESSRRPTQIYQREEEHITQEKINQVIAHIKIVQNQHTDKTVDVSVAMQRQFLQIQTLRRKSQRGSAGHSFPNCEGLEFRFCERAC